MCDHVPEIIGDITIRDLMNLQQRLANKSLKDGLPIVRKFRDQNHMTDPEALSIMRMAIKFEYDGPRC